MKKREDGKWRIEQVDDFGKTMVSFR